MPVAGRPLVAWSLAALRRSEAVAAIVVAAPPGHAYAFGDDVTVVAGGATRAESVANALAAAGGAEVVAIHDAARPLLTPELVEALAATLAAAPEAAGVIAAAPITDTVKRAAAITDTVQRAAAITDTVQRTAAPAERTAAADRAKTAFPTEAGENAALDRTKTAFGPREGPRAALVIAGTEDRRELWAAQTPQLFRAAALREALAVDAAVRDAATDEASLVEGAGGTVLIHPTGPENLKVTTPHDLRVAELFLMDREGP